jgi:hypothetical protein
MGAMQAMDLAESELIDLETQISIHLRSNHYPPVPNEMVPVCIEAIDKANEGEWEEFITLPEGTSWRGEPAAPVHAIVEGHHLEFWISESELD